MPEDRYQYWVMDGRAVDPQEGFEAASIYYCGLTLERARDAWKDWPQEYSIWRVDTSSDIAPTMVQAPLADDSGPRGWTAYKALHGLL